MTRFEDRLTDLLREASDGIDVSPGLTRAALADARRNQRKTLVLGAGAGLVGTGVIAAGAFALAAPTHQKLARVPAASGGAKPSAGTAAAAPPCVVPVPSPSGATSAAPATATAGIGTIAAGTDAGTATATTDPLDQLGIASAPALGGKPVPDAPPKPAGLDDISLPNPAPGFPLRRDHDSSFVQSGADGTGKLEWTRFFAVETSTPKTETYDCGAAMSTPTGPEATIMVMSRDDVAGSDGKLVEGSFPVTSTVTARGTTAYVAHMSEKEPYDILEVSTDKWTVIVTGDAGTRVPQMVALANAIDGI